MGHKGSVKVAGATFVPYVFSKTKKCRSASEGCACRVHFVEGPACQVRGSGVSRPMLRSGHDKRVLPFSIPIGVDRVSP